MSDQAQCTCLRAVYVPVHHTNGTVSDSWICEGCGRAFAPQDHYDRLRAEVEAVKAETERFAEVYAEKVTAGLRAEVERLREEQSQLQGALFQTQSLLITASKAKSVGRAGGYAAEALKLVDAALSPPPEPRAEPAPPPRSEKERWRANYVPSPHYYNLDHACALVNRAFGRSFGCYLVGSSLARRDHRDVDVRLILEDQEYDALFAGRDALWSLLCVSISLWLSQQSGLPVDFQVQRQTQANDTHKGQRSALGIFLEYPGDRAASEPTAKEQP